MKFSSLKHPLLFHVNTCAQLLSLVHLFATPWPVAGQAPLSMGFFRQEYWSAVSYSRGSSQPREQTCVSCISCMDTLPLHHLEAHVNTYNHWQPDELSFCFYLLKILNISKENYGSFFTDASKAIGGRLLWHWSDDYFLDICRPGSDQILEQKMLVSPFTWEITRVLGLLPVIGDRNQ